MSYLTADVEEGLRVFWWYQHGTVQMMKLSKGIACVCTVYCCLPQTILNRPQSLRPALPTKTKILLFDLALVLPTSKSTSCIYGRLNSEFMNINWRSVLAVNPHESCSVNKVGLSSVVWHSGEERRVIEVIQISMISIITKHSLLQAWRLSGGS